MTGHAAHPKLPPKIPKQASLRIRIDSLQNNKATQKQNNRFSTTSTTSTTTHPHSPVALVLPALATYHCVPFALQGSARFGLHCRSLCACRGPLSRRPLRLFSSLTRRIVCVDLTGPRSTRSQEDPSHGPAVRLCSRRSRRPAQLSSGCQAASVARSFNQLTVRFAPALFCCFLISFSPSLPSPRLLRSQTFLFDISACQNAVALESCRLPSADRPLSRTLRASSPPPLLPSASF